MILLGSIQTMSVFNYLFIFRIYFFFSIYYLIMPLKTKPRKYKRKRRYRRKMRSGFTSLSGGGLVSKSPMPKKFLFKTRYCEPIVTIDPSVAGIPATHVFQANSLYDPDYTGVGHQPIGYDQIMPMYDHYTVIGSRIRVSATNTDGGTPQTIVVALKDNVTAINDVGRTIENGQCRWGVLSESVAGGATKTLTLGFSANKFFGCNVLDGDKYKGFEGGNPNEGAYFHITVAPLEGVDAASVRCNVTIEYVAVLTEPKVLAQS